MKDIFHKFKFGWSKKDIWDMDRWFFNTIPNMIDCFSEETIAFPMPHTIEKFKKYFPDEKFKSLAYNKDIESKFISDRSVGNYNNNVRIEDECYLEDWKKILAKLLKNSNENTCEYVNEYDYFDKKESILFIDRENEISNLIEKIVENQCKFFQK